MINDAPPHPLQIVVGHLSRAWTSLLQVFQPTPWVSAFKPPPGFVMPPLITAVLHRKIDTVRQLLASGVDTSLMDDVHYNALHYAAMSGQQETVLLLLHSGAKINARNGTGSELTALALAVASDEEVVGKILISKGATIVNDSLTHFAMATYNRWRVECE